MHKPIKKNHFYLYPLKRLLVSLFLSFPSFSYAQIDYFHIKGINGLLTEKYTYLSPLMAFQVTTQNDSKISAIMPSISENARHEWDQKMVSNLPHVDYIKMLSEKNDYKYEINTGASNSLTAVNSFFTFTPSLPPTEKIF